MKSDTFYKIPHSIVKGRDLFPNEVLSGEASKRALTMGLLFAILLLETHVAKGAIGMWNRKEITLAQSKQHVTVTNKLMGMGWRILSISW